MGPTPSKIVDSKSHTVQGGKFACSHRIAADKCSGRGCTGRATCTRVITVTIDRYSDHTTRETRTDGAEHFVECENKPYFAGTRCELCEAEATRVGGWCVYQAPTETKVSRRREVSKPSACPHAFDCTSQGCTGKATCVQVTTFTVTQMSNGKSIESVDEGLTQRDKCECKRPYTGDRCQDCADGAVVVAGGTCLTQDEHHVHLLVAEVVRIRQQLGLCFRNINTSVPEMDLQRQLVAGVATLRAQAVADQLEQPARVRGREDALLSNVTGAQQLLAELEGELAAFWKPHVVAGVLGGGVLFVIVLTLAVLVFRLLRTMGGPPVQEQLTLVAILEHLDRSERRRERQFWRLVKSQHCSLETMLQMTGRSALPPPSSTTRRDRSDSSESSDSSDSSDSVATDDTQPAKRPPNSLGRVRS